MGKHTKKQSKKRNKRHYSPHEAPVDNMFTDAIDVIGGLFVLIIMPLISVGTAFWLTYRTQTFSFLNYGFPFMSIGAASAYDALNRYKRGALTEKKIKICATAGIATIIFIIVGLWSNRSYCWIAAPVCLIVYGVVVLRDVILKLKNRITSRQNCKR